MKQVNTSDRKMLPVMQFPQALPMASEATLVAPLEETEKTAQPRFYRPELDLLRFFAFFAVFTVHALSVSPGTIPRQGTIAPVGAYGLCLFFFLSSYLITELLLREHSVTGKIHVQAFYLRRILRIWPLYFGFLLFGKFLGHIYSPFYLETGRLIAFVFLAGNWYMTRFGSSWSPVEPLWSISVEEQFYLLWPTLARIGGRRLLLLISAALIPIAWIAIYTNTGRQPAAMGLEFDGTVWCSSIVQFQFFALGALCSLLLRGKVLHWSPALRLAVFGLGVASWFAASWLFRAGNFVDRLPPNVLVAGYSLIAVGCLLLFLSLLGIRAGSIPEPLIYLGKISYGLYVFHWLLLEAIFVVPNFDAGRFTTLHNSLPSFVAKYLLALAATVLAAALSYRFFEAPFLALKKRFTFVASRAI